MNNIYIIFLLTTLFTFSCDTKRESIGAADEILVVVSEEDRAEIINALSKIFNDTLYTPQPEPVYKLVTADPLGFQELKRQSNLIVGSIGDSELNLGTKLVKSLLGPDLFEETISGNEQIIFSENQFGRNQLFMIISGKSINEVINALVDKSDWIKSYFDKTFIEKQQKYLFGKDQQKKLSKEFQDDYGWQIKIPWGWEVLKNLPDSNFVWLGRELPYQWFSVHWEKGLVVENRKTAIEYSNNFARDYYQSIRYNDYKFEIEQVDFNNWTAWKTVGIWESMEGAGGGPFINYTWYDGVSDRTYNLNMLVYIPGKSKSSFLRQLDIMAHSFSTT